MSKSVISVSASGIEAYSAYASILREHEDDLKAVGIEYAEHDHKAEPVTATLIISVAVTTLVTASVTELVKKLFGKIGDTLKKEDTSKDARPIIVIVRIGREDFDLRTQRDAVLARIDALKTDV